jgi:hypothetical protein
MFDGPFYPVIVPRDDNYKPHVCGCCGQVVHEGGAQYVRMTMNFQPIKIPQGVLVRLPAEIISILNCAGYIPILQEEESK